MVNYICDRCNKIFNHKSTYARHLNRKILCSQNGVKMAQSGSIIEQIKSTYVCEKCNKSYTQKKNLKRHHIYYCKYKNEINEQVNNDNIIEKIKMMEQEITNLKQSIVCNAMNNTTNNTTNNTINNNNFVAIGQQNNIVQINSFGKEQVDITALRSKQLKP